MLRGLCRASLLVANVRPLSAAAAQPASSSATKEALMKLRKRTGYSYVNCRKALTEFGPDKLEEAEKWLRELAKKEGWAKAAKLSTRSTSQGLVGVTTSGPNAAVVELLCETDFVARGDNFKALLEQLAVSALEHASKNVNSTGGKIAAVTFNLEDMTASDGRSLKEIVTMAVGKLGENITVKKIEGYAAPTGSSLHSAAHPREGTAAVNMGKFVSLIALKRAQEQGLFPTEKLAPQICQHIIGMRSETLGEAPVDVEKKVEAKASVDSGKDELNDFFQGQTTEVDENETALLRQSFMLNPSQTVHAYLEGHKAEVLDFVRSELGGEKDN